MSLRRSLIAVSLAATALSPLPALAQERDGETAGAVADKLRDPASQIAVAAVLSSMSEALLDLRIGPFVQAMDKAGLGGDDMRDLPPDARLGDVTGRRTREMPARIARETPKMMGDAAGMADAVQDMLPQLREMGRRMKQSIPRY
jgi:hypothetical protein